jgi:hypothetical protein
VKVKWYKVPEKIDIKIFPSEVEGEEGLYIASIDGHGQDLNLYTQGGSPIQALRAALSALCGVTNSCSVNRAGHCWCQTPRRYPGDGTDDNGRLCCHCGTWRNEKMFSEP